MKMQDHQCNLEEVDDIVPSLYQFKHQIDASIDFKKDLDFHSPVLDEIIKISAQNSQISGITDANAPRKESSSKLHLLSLLKEECRSNHADNCLSNQSIILDEYDIVSKKVRSDLKKYKTSQNQSSQKLVATLFKIRNHML